jgi:hypothetical protein
MLAGAYLRDVLADPLAGLIIEVIDLKPNEDVI